jgi:hypothetical protein
MTSVMVCLRMDFSVFRQGPLNRGSLGFARDDKGEGGGFDRKWMLDRGVLRFLVQTALSTRAYKKFLPRRSQQRQLMWFLKRSTCIRTEDAILELSSDRGAVREHEAEASAHFFSLDGCPMFAPALPGHYMG